MKEFNIYEPFVGAGGFTLAFEKYFNVAKAVEKAFDPYKTWQNNHGNVIQQMSVKDVNYALHDYDGIVGVVGGSPCPDFSRLNRKKDPKSLRALLIYEMIRAAEEIDPTFVVIENVNTVPKWIKIDLIKALINLGYGVVSKVINFYNFGSIQSRKRWIVIAMKIKGSPVRVYPQPINEIRLAKELLVDLPKTEYRMTDDVRQRINKANFRPGMWEILPGSKSTYASYIIVDPNRPFPWVGHPSKMRYLYDWGDGLEYLPFNVMAKAQEFPSDYKWHGGLTSRGLQVANSVPSTGAIPFAEKIYETLVS